jgi:hypothetical protein
MVGTWDRIAEHLATDTQTMCVRLSSGESIPIIDAEEYQCRGCDKLRVIQTDLGNCDL